MLCVVVTCMCNVLMRVVINVYVKNNILSPFKLCEKISYWIGKPEVKNFHDYQKFPIHTKNGNKKNSYVLTNETIYRNKKNNNMK